MAWSWSHTAEAYDNVRQNIEDLPRAVLIEIYAEWQACIKENEFNKRVWQLEVEFGKTSHDGPEFDPNAWCQANYDIAMDAAERLPTDVLVDFIHSNAESLAICDNGGFNAYVCPTGCHRVLFDRMKAYANDE